VRKSKIEGEMALFMGCERLFWGL